MEMKEFAPEYPRNELGWIQFPRDDQYRKQLFQFWDREGLKLSEHPAKANIYLVQSIVEFVSEPDQTILDIMAGTGTIMVAALVGRRVICIEIEEGYQRMIEWGIQDLERIAPGISNYITLIPGDCAKVLPLPTDHIIFSPPYAQIMRKKTMDKFTLETLGTGILEYSKSPENVGNLNEFLYHQKMEIIYKKCYESLPPGGTLTIIIKDHMEKGKRVYIGERAKKDCIKLGFELAHHFKWEPPGTAYISYRKARGETVVEDEDIIILRRPK